MIGNDGKRTPTRVELRHRCCIVARNYAMNIFCIVSSGFVYPNLDLILKSLNTKLNDEIIDLIC